MIQNVLTQEAPPGTADQSENPVERVFHEDELRIVRRLDWRFLLADPNLKEVAYIGPDDKNLVDSLSYFSDAFTRFEWPESDALRKRGRSFDLVVCRAGSEALKTAHILLKTGGSVYWELERTTIGATLLGGRKKVKGSENRGHFRKYVRRMQEAGFQDVRAYWHRPDFDRCLDIVPLDHSAALSYFFSKDGTDLKGKVKKAGGWLLNQGGLLSFMAPCFSVVGCKL